MKNFLLNIKENERNQNRVNNFLQNQKDSIRFKENLPIVELTNQNKEEDGGLLGFTPSVTEYLNEMEDILLQYQERGLAISLEKKEEIQTLLNNSVFSSTMLLNLINDLLDLAKIENSSFNLNWSYFNLFEVIEHSVETLNSQLSQKKIIVTHVFNKKDMNYFQ